MSARTGRYLYAVARGITSNDLTGVTGLRDRPVRGVDHQGLTAVISDVDLDEFGTEGLRRNLEDLDWLEEVARTHHAVVRAVAALAPAAPLRLATIYVDDDALRNRLDEWRDALLRALDRIEGRMEWSVKAFAPADEPEPSPPDATAGEGAGAAYLRRRKAAVERQRAAGDESAALADHLHLELSRHAAASRRLAPQDRKLSGHEGTMTLNGAYLVATADVEEFLATARELDRSHPEARINLQGPWPPYSFATLEDP